MRERWRRRRRGGPDLAALAADVSRHDAEITGLATALEGVFLATQPQPPAPAERQLRLVEPGPDDTGPLTSVA